MILMTPTVIIITGLPATGKTTIAGEIAEKLCLPLLSKDQIKESLGDSLGCGSIEQSKSLGPASYKILFLMIEKLVFANISCVTETFFRNEISTDFFLSLPEKHPCRLIQILLKSDLDVIIKRLDERVHAGDRHPVHRDTIDHDIKKELYDLADYDGLALKCPKLEIDMTGFSKRNLEKIFTFINSQVNL